MLNGKSALVTGSTSGIGHAIASVLVAEGCNVMLNGFGDAGEIEHMRSALAEAYDVTVAFSPADMGSGDEIGDLFEQLSRELGEVDILVNNAAAPESRQEAAIEDLPPERWDQAMAVNLSSAYHTSRLAIPGMKQRDWGRIVNIASSFALFGSKNKVDYVASKTGLVGLTRGVALETAEFDITCNAICPGWTLTPHQEGNIERHSESTGLGRDEAIADMMESRQPSKRFVYPEHIGALVAFLCSDAAQEITGTAIPIDGGWAAE